MKKITVVAIIFLFLVIFSGCVSQVDAPLWEEGKAHFEEGEYEKAYLALSTSVKTNEEGNAYAYALLGDMYDSSYYVTRDEGQAFSYWQEAVERGADASYWVKLGACYSNGKGVETDIHKALECFEQALEQGYDEENVEEIKALVEELKIMLEEQKESE